MVLINELTVEQINAALLHLQRSKDEVVGGVKGNTTQNISITNSGGGGGNNVDYSGAIQNLANNIEKNSESIEEIKVDVHNLEETIRNLSDAGISDLSYDNLSHQLTITTENGDTFQAQITQDVATLSFDPATNELSITTGEQTQTITLPIPSAQVQSDWTQTDNTEPDFIKNKIPIWITSGSADDNMSPVDVVQAGNTRPVTSGGVANVLALPTDAVLHYSFDEVPDYPDGSAFNYYNKNFVASDWMTNNSSLTVTNGILKIASTGSTSYAFIRQSNYSNTTLANKILKARIFIHSINTNSGCNLRVVGQDILGQIDIGKENYDRWIDISFLIGTGTTSQQWLGIIFNTTSAENYWQLEVLYIGDGSYSTPIIDNANGQNNATNNGGIAVQGVSGKAIKCFNKYVQTKFQLDVTKDFTVSLWIKPDNNTMSQVGYILRKENAFHLLNGESAWSTERLYLVMWDTSANQIGITLGSLLPTDWTNLVIKKEGNKIFSYRNGIKSTEQTITSNIRNNTNNLNLNFPSNTRPQSYDDLLIFDRALSEQEVQALYLNKANTPKYYDLNNYNINKEKMGLQIFRVNANETRTITLSRWGAYLLLGNIDNGGNCLFAFTLAGTTFAVNNWSTGTGFVSATITDNVIKCGVSTYYFTMSVSAFGVVTISATTNCHLTIIGAGGNI